MITGLANYRKPVHELMVSWKILFEGGKESMYPIVVLFLARKKTVRFIFATPYPGH